MKSAIHAKRKTDAVISIKQDNIAKKLIVSSMNKAAEKLTGYTMPELLNKPFNNILTPRINEILEGYLEYGNSASDFAMISRRIPNFQIITKNRNTIPVSLKTYNLVTQNTNVQEFELLLRDITLIKKIAELKELIASSANRIKEKDPQTGLPSINTVVYAIDKSYSFLEQYSSIDVCFVMLENINLAYYGDNYGEYVAYEIIGTLGGIAKRCLRTEDMLGYMGNGAIGMVLLDCNLENAKGVMKRIKTKVDAAKITMQDGKTVTISLAIAYTQIKKDRDMTAMIDACEDGLDRIRNRGTEGMVQV